MHLISAFGKPYLEEKKFKNKRETKYKFTMQNNVQKRNGSDTKHEDIAKTGEAVYRKRKTIL